MAGRIDTHDGPRAFGIIVIFVGWQDAKAKCQAGATEFFHPNPNADVANADDWAEVFDGVGPDEMKLVGVFLGIEDAAPTEMLPKRADGAFEEEQVAGVVQNLKGIEVVEIDAHPGFVKTRHGRGSSTVLLIGESFGARLVGGNGERVQWLQAGSGMYSRKPNGEVRNGSRRSLFPARSRARCNWAHCNMYRKCAPNGVQGHCVNCAGSEKNHLSSVEFLLFQKLPSSRGKNT